jgi:lysophospholipase L1-like esterase
VDAFSNETLRQVVNLHFGGEMVRVQLSNRFGDQPVSFDEASVGLQRTGAALVSGSERPLSFGGDRSVTIPPGQEVVSDAVALRVEPFSDLVVSVFTAGPTGPATVHASALQNYYTAMGNHVANPSGDVFHARGDTSHPHSSTFTTQWFFLTEIEVLAPAATRTVVAVGESTTVGFFSSGDANRRYPDVLARRLLANPATQDIALVAQAIIGNRILHDQFGPSTLNRLDREVLSHPDLDAVILVQGLNDIGQPALVPEEVTAEEIVAGYQEIAQRVHARGARIYIGTLTPAGDMTKPILYGRYSLPESVAKRHAVNAWIRDQDVFDGMVDLDAVVRSPTNPDHVNPKYDGGDNLHLNDAGYAAIAEAIPLPLFEGRSGC